MLLKGNRNTDPFRCTFLPWPRTRRWSSRGTRTTAASHWTTSRWSPWQTCSPVGHVQEPNQFYPIVSLIKSSNKKTIYYHWYNVNATRQNNLIVSSIEWFELRVHEHLPDENKPVPAGQPDQPPVQLTTDATATHPGPRALQQTEQSSVDARYRFRGGGGGTFAVKVRSKSNVLNMQWHLVS